MSTLRSKSALWFRRMFAALVVYGRGVGQFLVTYEGASHDRPCVSLSLRFPSFFSCSSRMPKESNTCSFLTSSIRLVINKDRAMYVGPWYLSCAFWLSLQRDEHGHFSVRAVTVLSLLARHDLPEEGSASDDRPGPSPLATYASSTRSNTNLSDPMTLPPIELMSLFSVFGSKQARNMLYRRTTGLNHA